MQMDPSFDKQSQSEGNLDKEFIDLLKQRGESSKAYLFGTVLAITFGGFFCISGFIIAVLGLTGSIEWIFEAGSLKSRLSNASPGAFFALLGMIVLWRYKPKTTDSFKISPKDSIIHEENWHGPRIPIDRVEHDKGEYFTF